MSSKKCYHCGREAGTHGRPDIYHTDSCPTRSFAPGENVQMVKMTYEQAQAWEHIGAAIARGPVEIGYHEIMEIKTLAHQKLLQAPVPKSAVDDVRAWYLMEALSRFLESKGIKSPFKMKE